MPVGPTAIFAVVGLNGEGMEEYYYIVVLTEIYIYIYIYIIK